MKANGLVASIKTFLLLLLVGVSFVLSYQLWVGFWGGNASEVGTEVLPTPAATSPTPAQLRTPLEIVVHDASRSRTTVEFPSTGQFTHWEQLVKHARINGFRQLGSASSDYQNTVTFQFGYTLSKSNLLQLAPGIASYNDGMNSDVIILSDDPYSDVISLVIPNGNGTDWFTTNIAASQFANLLQAADARPAWVALPGSPTTYVPEQPMRMSESLWQTREPLQMALVRSFFVNPLALTSLSGAGKNSNIWTDGSRIVWWNQPLGDLTYQDPNSTTGAGPSAANMDVAASFVRAHGGAPSNSVAITQTQSPQSPILLTFTMRPYLSGFPIVDGSADYQVQFNADQVTEYVRPIWELVAEESSKQVRIMGFHQLTAVMQQLSPGFSWGQYNVQLGYATQTKVDGTILFIPVYVLSSEGLDIWTLSAVNGQPVKG